MRSSELTAINEAVKIISEKLGLQNSSVAAAEGDYSEGVKAFIQLAKSVAVSILEIFLIFSLFFF